MILVILFTFQCLFKSSIFFIELCRLSKEKVMYEKEVVDQSAKIDKMKAENKDEHDIKKQVSSCGFEVAVNALYPCPSSWKVDTCGV